MNRSNCCLLLGRYHHHLQALSLSTRHHNRHDYQLLFKCIVQHHPSHLSSTCGNRSSGFKTSLWNGKESSVVGSNLGKPIILDHSLIDALISSESSKESVNDNLSLLCNQSDITEERLTLILNRKVIDKLDPSTIITLMQFYARNGNAPKVKELFKHIRNPNEDMKKTLLQLLALSGSTLKTKTNPEIITSKMAQNLVRTMPSTINVAHKRSISELKEVEDTLKKKKDSVSYAHSVVIEAFSIRGQMKQAEHYFENIQHVNTEVLNSMIDGWIRTLMRGEKHQLNSKTGTSSVVTGTSSTSTSAIDTTTITAISNNNVEEEEGMNRNKCDEFNHVRERVYYYFNLYDLYKVKRDVRTYSYILKFKFMEAVQFDSKDPDINPIIELIENMMAKERISIDHYFVSTFIARFKTIQSKPKAKRLYGVYKKFLSKVKLPDASNLTLLSTLASSKCFPEALSLFEQLKRTLPSKEKKTAYEIMISMFLENDNEAAIVLMDEMMQKKIPRSLNIYFSIMNHFSQQFEHKTVAKYFQLMQSEGLEPSPSVLGASLRSLAHTKTKQQVMDLLKQSELTKKLNEESCAAFIGAYGILEELEEAERVFSLFKETNKLSIYNEMLCTYVNLSCIGDAITLYLDYPMKGDIVTYETLVEALGISKEYSAIIQIHKIMIKLGIVPTYKYYEQLIDILTKESVSDSEVKPFLQSLPDEMSQFHIEKIEQLIMRLLF